ncbi:MAG: hypothetical protein GMKNLPBB_00186 [Myxococcota bacterium]|nr:hypothetical protein [Myxococcota bacterium]
MKWVRIGVYALLAAAGLWMVREPVLRAFWLSLGETVYYPALPNPLWTAVAVVFLVYLGVMTWKVSGGKPVPTPWTAVFLAAFVLAAAGQAFFRGSGSPPSWSLLEDAPPHVQVEAAMDMVCRGGEIRAAKSGVMPSSEADYESILREGKFPPLLNYRKRWERLPLSLVLIRNQNTPPDRYPEGSGPGTVVIGISSSADRIWVSGVGMNSYPRGPTGWIKDSRGGQAILACRAPSRR